jgi:CubicO group peptidase (beta-lactamase class C family)
MMKVPLTMLPDTERLREFLLEGASRGLYTSASLWVTFEGNTFEVHTGEYHWYDLASLTKPIVIGTLFLLLLSRGVLRLSNDVTAILPFPLLKGITWERILRHEGGLIAYAPWYREFPPSPIPLREFLLKIIDPRIRIVPEGTPTVYSDLGFILLGYALEEIYGKPLWKIFEEEILSPLGIGELTYFADKTSNAPTGYCPWRNRTLQGEPHDPHAYLLLGSAGHAGLFGTARGVGKIVTAYLQGKEKGILDAPPSWVERFLAIPSDPTRRPLAWDRPGPGKSQAGKRVPPDAVGHLGFTGTSIWFSPQRRCGVVFLTNRVFSDPEGETFRQFRPELHDLIWG